MMMDANRMARAFLAICGIAAVLSVWAAMLAVAVHFIAKFW